MSNNLERKTSILLAIFITALVLANILGSKMTSVFGIITSVGIFAYPITFLITDVIEEVRGKKVALQFFYSGIIAIILSLILVWIGIAMPPASFYANNEAYKTVFGNSIRVLLASLTAFLIAQSHDIWAFQFWKKKTNGRFLWLRNNASTIVSQFIDTIIFTFIAFFLVTPEYTVVRMFQIIFPYWGLKVIWAVADTPAVYALSYWLRK